MNTTSNLQESNVHATLRTMNASDFLRVLEEATPEQLSKLSELGSPSSAEVPVFAPFSKLLRVEPPTGLRSILTWWETRRPFYNAVVALSGLPGLFILGAYAQASTLSIISSVLCYAAAANLCYLLGPALTFMAWLRWKQGAAHISPLLFTVGTLFSVLVTSGASLIILMALLITVAR